MVQYVLTVSEYSRQ